MNTDNSALKKGISAGALKMIAVVTMLIDHVAATILVRHFYATGDYSLYDFYFVLRQIGRIAFPIYCFMLVEGLERTRSKTKYLLRMAGFALISEIPFDLAFSSEVLEFGYQNVFFTLTIGLAVMIVLHKIETGMHNLIAQFLLYIPVVLAGMAMAGFMRTDYDWRGVACILVMYLLRRNLKAQLIAGYAAFVLLLGEIAASPAFILLAFYRGRKGFTCKAFFYGFYPIHLLILYFACVILRIASYSAI